MNVTVTSVVVEATGNSVLSRRQKSAGADSVSRLCCHSVIVVTNLH